MDLIAPMFGRFRADGVHRRISDILPSPSIFVFGWHSETSRASKYETRWTRLEEGQGQDTGGKDEG
jgi:hypothetical protein